MSDVFVIVGKDFRAHVCQAGSTYWSILEDLYYKGKERSHSLSGAIKLMRNGEIVVDGGLEDLAREYTVKKAKYYQLADEKAKAECMPDWLKESSNG